MDRYIEAITNVFHKVLSCRCFTDCFISNFISDWDVQSENKTCSIAPNSLPLPSTSAEFTLTIIAYMFLLLSCPYLFSCSCFVRLKCLFLFVQLLVVRSTPALSHSFTRRVPHTPAPPNHWYVIFSSPLTHVYNLVVSGLCRCGVRASE